MYLLFMIKARIRWCTCRVENILTLGKLVSLWFVSSSILFVFDISNLLSYIQISSYELARPIMGTIFLVYVCMYNMCVCRGPKSVGGITWAKRAHAQSQYWAVKSDQ